MTLLTLDNSRPAHAISFNTTWDCYWQDELLLAPCSAISSSGLLLNNNSLRFSLFFCKLCSWNMQNHWSSWQCWHDSGSRWWREAKRKRDGWRAEAFVCLGKPGQMVVWLWVMDVGGSGGCGGGGGGGGGDGRWPDHLWSAYQSGQNSRNVKKCSHFNIPPEHK